MLVKIDRRVYKQLYTTACAAGPTTRPVRWTADRNEPDERHGDQVIARADRRVVILDATRPGLLSRT